MLNKKEILISGILVYISTVFLVNSIIIWCYRVNKLENFNFNITIVYSKYHFFRYRR